MKETFTRQEVREVIQEIIGDFWNNLLHKVIQGNPSGTRDTGQKLLKKNRASSEEEMAEHHLYKNVDKWVDDVVDIDDGKYIGPTLHGRNYEHNFYKGDIIRENPTEDITQKDIQKMMEWNESYAHDAGISIQVVSAFNTKVWDHYRHHKPSKIFGSFPT